MTGVGRSGGAGTIVNAMATGRGAAFGLGFKVVAQVRRADAWQVFNGGKRLGREEARVALACARLVQREEARPTPWRIDVDSDIPPQRGLKSSSAVSVAVLSAALDEMGARWTHQRILNAAADAGLASGTSVTGAFDDAAACLLGGVVITDNRRRKILARAELPKGLAAAVNVPKAQRATATLRGKDFTPIADLAAEAFRLARQGHIRDAMLLNTAAYASFLRHDCVFTLRTLAAGAWAAGLSGKGPAEIALAAPTTAATLRKRFPAVLQVPLRRGQP